MALPKVLDSGEANTTGTAGVTVYMTVAGLMVVPVMLLAVTIAVPMPGVVSVPVNWQELPSIVRLTIRPGGMATPVQPGGLPSSGWIAPPPSFTKTKGVSRVSPTTKV